VVHERLAHGDLLENTGVLLLQGADVLLRNRLRHRRRGASSCRLDFCGVHVVGERAGHRRGVVKVAKLPHVRAEEVFLFSKLRFLRLHIPVDVFL